MRMRNKWRKALLFFFFFKEKVLNNNVIPLWGFVGFDFLFSQNWLGNLNVLKCSKAQNRSMRRSIWRAIALLVYWLYADKYIDGPPNRHFINKSSFPLDLSKVATPWTKRKLQETSLILSLPVHGCLCFPANDWRKEFQRDWDPDVPGESLGWVTEHFWSCHTWRKYLPHPLCITFMLILKRKVKFLRLTARPYLYHLVHISLSQLNAMLSQSSLPSLHVPSCIFYKWLHLRAMPFI